MKDLLTFVAEHPVFVFFFTFMVLGMLHDIVGQFRRKS